MTDKITISLDKMMKHGTIFSLTYPKPSEPDIMIKIWAGIFEVLLHNTDIYIRWQVNADFTSMNNINIIHIYRSEKGLTTGETDRIMFKLDAKLVLMYNNNE